MRTGLQTGALDKCLKTLEARQLVKSATSAQGARGKKKIYIWQAALLVSLALTHATSAALSFGNCHAPMFCLATSAFFAL